MKTTRSAMNQSPGPIALRISPSDLSPDSLGDSLPDRDGKAPDLSANPGTLFLLRISASPAPVTGGACTGARLSGAASGTLQLPRLDFGDGLAQLPGLFLDEPVEVVAHGDAELGVDLIVPLLEPGEKLDQAGQEGDEAGVVAAAEAFLDVDVIGADRPGELEVVVAGPGDDERARPVPRSAESLPSAPWARRACPGAASSRPSGSRRSCTWAGTGMLPTCFFLSAFASSSVRCSE